MKTRTILMILSLGGAFVAFHPASAWVQVLGTGKAHDCWIAAKTHGAPAIGIATCTTALTEQNLDPNDRAKTLVNRGVLKSAQGLPTEAMIDFEAGIALMPELGDAYVDRGVLLIALSRYGEAFSDINKGIGLGLSYPHVGYYNRAVAEDFMGRYQDAYNDYKHALELDPGYTQASEQLKRFKVSSPAASY